MTPVAVNVAVKQRLRDLVGIELAGRGGAPGRNRTDDISLTRRVLWPTELQGRAVSIAAAPRPGVATLRTMFASATEHVPAWQVTRKDLR